MRRGLRAALAVLGLVLAPVAATGTASTGAAASSLGPLPDPVVTMSPDLLVVGALPERASVRFDAWSDDVASVEVRLAGIPLDPPLDVSGSGASGRVDLPDGLPCGRQVLEAVWRPYGNDPGPRSTRGAVTVQCPTLRLTPSEIGAADQPSEIVWAVSGLVPDSAVALTLDGETLAVVDTDARGGARFRGGVDDLGCGVHRATAVDRSTPGTRKELGIDQDAEIAATAPLFVTCPAPVDPVDPVAPVAPGTVVVPSLLAVDPEVVAAGTTTRATGTLFPVGQDVVLSWRLPGGRTEPAGTVRVAPDGRFTADVLVLGSSLQGPRELVATASAGATASDLALVVAGTTQPGRNGLVSRR